jgi:hypothetical protein
MGFNTLYSPITAWGLIQVSSILDQFIEFGGKAAQDILGVRSDPVLGERSENADAWMTPINVAIAVI